MAGYKWFRRLQGLTQQQAESRAQRLQQLTEEKEKYCIVQAPGDVTVRATSDLSLSGTGTAFDTTYKIETVEHRFSVSEGYTMTVTAKNSSSGDTGFSGGTGDTPSAPATPTKTTIDPGFTSG